MDSPVRRLSIDDLPACQRLAEDREWGKEDHKWRFLFSVGDVYGIDDGHGDLAATVVSTPYGKDVAAISMVLVVKRYERRGLGARIMRHAMDEAGTASLCLTATAMGRPLYERLGFRSVGSCTTYTGVVDGPFRHGASRPATSADMPAVHALDTEVFGAERFQVVEGLPSFCSAFHVVRDESGMAGFGGVWWNDGRALVGPVVARDAETALTLVDEIVPRGPVRLDIDHRHPELVEWVEKRGLTPFFSTTIMEYGEPIANDPARLFLPVAQALG
ncbi:GNAT family N-acetyltransferase [Actinomadura verrucosospora]|uniref:N-acetyltransferase n=1 Tax=Actinomadura verrucosospora TaxID=46165 RepID=A0A7D3ZNR1_ACTVE|nr:GNAT family N-acetyltransferase [Actinomadura verrucosospora]QKG22882.1 N-acetyltransferase [Actinomadura verrucosospora]